MNLQGYDLIARHFVAVKDLGATDRLFGGVMLAWLDEAGAAYAMIQARTSNLVTRYVEAMSFLAPGRVGDVLAIYGRVAGRRTSSLSVEMKVFAEDPQTGAGREIVTTTFVFVAIDKWGKKTLLPKLPPEN